MTMTGRVMADQIGDEFLPDDEAAVPWAHEVGAIDAGVSIPSGSTIEAFKGEYGFGIPSSMAREKKHGRRRRGDVVRPTRKARRVQRIRSYGS